MAIGLHAALDEATLAAREAGRLLRDDLHRRDGPRGHVDLMEIAERLLLAGDPD